MTQTMDLNRMGLAPMSELEMMEVDGEFKYWALVGLALGVAACVVTGGAATPVVMAMGDALAGMSVCATFLGA